MTDFMRAELDDGRTIYLDPFDVVAVSEVFHRDQRGPLPKVDTHHCEVVTQHGTYRLHDSAEHITDVVIRGTMNVEVRDG